MSSVYGDALTLGDAPFAALQVVRRRGSMENVLCRGNALTAALAGEQDPNTTLALPPWEYAALTEAQHRTLMRFRITVRPYHTVTITEGR